VGNELGTDPNLITIYPTVNDTLLHGNHENGVLSWDPDIDDRHLPDSLYHPSPPAFFGSTPWPATGADLLPAVQPLPAEQRYLQM
jgi:hypothetical protein